MATITETIKQGKILISDGAWGTIMQKEGLVPGECPELWSVNKPQIIADIAKNYAEAGADMVSTNSFGGNRYKLEHYGLAHRVAEINKTAAQVSRAAVGENKWVIGSMGSTGKMLVIEEITPEEMYDCYKEQAIALEQGGANAACIETMSDIEEAEIAIKAVKENTGLEIICTFTFELNVRGEYRTMMGVSPSDAAQAMIEAGADIIGTNCGNGIERMIDIVKEMRAINQNVPILVHANAGLPQNIDGKDVFPESPQDMASRVPDTISAGANIIGGCCGTTPEHIRAIALKVNNKA